jgi:triosephosphate isomerase
MYKIIANWKMNGSQSLCDEFILWAQRWQDEISRRAIGHLLELVICPPFVYLERLASGLQSYANVKLGAQNCSEFPEGAYTGEVSCRMLKETGCRYILLGHSERRSFFKENADNIKNKFIFAKKNGIIPIVCVGEDKITDTGAAVLAIKSQLGGLFQYLQTTDSEFYLAYEPVWAIGGTVLPDLEYIEGAAMNVQALLPNCSQSAIFYGGSVNSANIEKILNCQGITGVLVGSASLEPENFHKIVLQLCDFASELMIKR